jgi:hypothetical protein
MTSFGRFYFGIAYSRLDDAASATRSNDVSAFVQWSTQ